MAASNPRVVQARLIARTDAALQRVLLDAARDAERLLRRRSSVFSTRVNQAQLLRVLDDLRALSHDLWVNQVPPEIAKQIAAAEQAATVGVDELDRLMINSTRDRELQRTLIDSQRQRAKRVAQVTKVRETSAKFELSPKVYKWEALTNDVVERTIASAIDRGAPARDIAGAVRGLINPNTRGGASFAAKRLGRTEVANAYHRTTIDEYTNDPFVRGLKWNLSRSHPKPDECDQLARGHSGRMAEGVYRALDTPSKPHPQCLCFLTPVPISNSALQRGLSNGTFDGYLRGKYPDLDVTAFAA